VLTRGLFCLLKWSGVLEQDVGHFVDALTLSGPARGA
jgi:hypothetical protein